ncbi:DUF4870 domain-containing protein [Tenacibaculum finnmarkense genomovar ulcerans]|nr:DUF4870 domain-containing protein [Tenacibaculum finnmarkense genomovar ulcerans]MCG8238152.1 DUF4870 domain-containing protein [Tenacibaculum finnmarkense genomovar ulcerans]MCG8732626.1 DUF4870 domain-containing protein [Tenacibaculum finnmarkense]MCG8806781.1 DUF4870 domain-containing protein [Tenacibaculum finnmarkense]MCG8817021.1 DUF4870 domain-containing protein [Tenacibaculum finnmarkense]
MMPNNENTNAFLIHLSAFTGYFFPLGNIIAPLILWQVFKSDTLFLNNHGKEAVNFNLSYTLYLFITSTVFFLFLSLFFFGNVIIDIYNKPSFNFDTNHTYFSIFSIIGLFISGFLMLTIFISSIALIIIASIKANKGEEYQYPFSIKFIK